MLRAITIPDVEPTLPKGSAFSLVAGLAVVICFQTRSCSPFATQVISKKYTAESLILTSPRLGNGMLS